MKYFFITLNGYGEMLKKKFWGRSLFEYARKDNFDAMSGMGKWGHIHLGRKLEEAYFSLLTGNDEREFPGEAFIRSQHHGLQLRENRTAFIVNFLTLSDSRVVETCVNLSDREMEELLDCLSYRRKKFQFSIGADEAIAIFDRDFPAEAVSFPSAMLNRDLSLNLYKSVELDEINRIVKGSAALLESHPINSVRMDLGEPCANLAWFWGMGKQGRTVSLPELAGKNCFYLPLNGELTGLPELLGFQKIKDIRLKDDNALLWINHSIDVKEGPSIWLKRFEILDKNILGGILEEYNRGNCRVLFIFDCFTGVNTEVHNSWGAYLLLTEASAAGISIKKRLKRGSSCLEKFLS